MINRLDEIFKEIQRDKDNKIIECNDKVLKIKYKDMIQFNRIRNIMIALSIMFFIRSSPFFFC